MAGRHGHRRRPPRKGTVQGCACQAKGSCFSTREAAMRTVATTKDAERAYRGDCCGHYHITRYTVDEFAQRRAEYDAASKLPRHDLTGIQAVARAARIE